MRDVRPCRVVAFLLAALAHPGPLRADPVKARPAAEFVDSVGVNVHAHTRYEKNHDAVKKKLGELGVKHVRDGAHPNACKYAKEFFDEHGIRTTFITGRRVGGKEEWKSPLDPAKIADELADVKKLAGVAATAAVEGPNEYDLFRDDREKDWAGKLRAYQAEVYKQVKADPDLKAVPVVAPSLTSEDAYKAVGDVDAAADFSCLHLYQSTRHPGTGGWGPGGYGSIDWALDRLVKQQSPKGKPTQSTECGYKPGDKTDPLPEAVDAAYTPRMYAEFFRRGFARSFKYELLGDEWGLLRDDLSERPSFAALKNLLAVLREPAADGAKDAAGALDYTAAGGKDVREVPLVKRDGTFCLLLWREVAVYDPAGKKEVAVKPADVVLSFANRPKAVEVYDPVSPAKPAAAHADTARVTVPVGGNLLVVVVKPS